VTAVRTQDDHDGEATIRAGLNALVVERQALRRAGADHATLEANRIAIVYWQQRLVSQIGFTRSS
jgi:hypothetical protein